MTFEERSRRALERRKKPVEDGSVISLPDQGSLSSEPKTDTPVDSGQNEDSAEAQTSKLRYEAGASGFLIVESDGTKRKPSEAEEDQIIRTEMGDTLRDDVSQMELVRVSEAEITELEGADAPAAISTDSEYAKSEQLEEAQKNIRARLEAVKAKVGDEHFKRLQDHIDAATKPIEIKGISEALQVYEASSKAEGAPAEPRPPQELQPPKGKKGKKSGAGARAQEAATPEAKGIDFDSSSEKAEFVKIGETIMVRQGRKNRLATESEVRSFYSLGDPEQEAAVERGERAKDGIPRDSHKEDYFEQHGITMEELKNRVARSSAARVGATGPKIRQAGREARDVEREAKELRALLLQRLDPSKFAPKEIHADWTGGESRRHLNTYSHPDALGISFTQAERDWVASGFRGPSPDGVFLGVEAGARDVEEGEMPLDARGMPQGMPVVDVTMPVPEQLVAPRDINGVIPDFVKQRHSRDRGQPIFEDVGPTMDVILREPKKQELFGELLKARGRESLIGKYMAARDNAAAMSPIDIAELNAMRAEFAHRLALAEEVSVALSQQDVETMYKRNSGFALLAGSLEPAVATAVIKDHTFITFMRIGTRDLNSIVLSQRALRDIRSDRHYRRLRDRTRRVARMHGINPEQIDLNRVDDTFINKMMKPTWRDLLFRGIGKEATQLSYNAANENIENMANVLGASLLSDAYIRERIVRAATNPEEKVPALGTESAANMKAAAAERNISAEKLDPEALLSKVKGEEYRKNFKTADGKTWAEASPDEREATFFEQYESEALSRRKERGWFASWVWGLFDSLLDRTRARMKAENAFA